MKQRIIVTLAALFCLTTVFADNFQVDNVRLKPGDTKDLKISLASTVTDVYGVQFDVTIPEGLSLELINNQVYSLSVDQPNDVTCNVSSLAGNTYRFVLYSSSLQKLKGGELMNLNLKASTATPLGNYDISFKEIAFSDLDGKVTKESGVNATALVTSFVPSAQNIQMADVAIKSGSMASLNIKLLESISGCAGIQFDLVLPEGFSIEKEANNQEYKIASVQANDISCFITDKGNGVYRFVLYSNSLKEFVSGDLMDINLKAVKEKPSGNYTITMNNVILSDKAGNIFNDAGANANVIVTKLYSLSYLVDGEEYKTYEFEEGAAITAEAEPTKEGYTFSGWSEIPETMPAKDVTITGTFQLISYAISYDLKDGTLPEGKSNPTSYTIESEAISLVSPVKTGYTFIGWTGTGLTEATTSVTIVKGSTGVRTYTANWKSQNMPYAVLSDNNTKLTFYYDDQKAARNGMSVGPFGWNGIDRPNTSWFDQRENIATVEFDASFANCNTITSTAWWFYFCKNLTTITNISNLKTDNVTDMLYMFRDCSSLTSLNVSGFKTDHVIEMGGMFMNCSGLTSLDVSGFKTDIVTNMQAMFWGCRGLTSLDLSGFKTDNVTDMGCMFFDCFNLATLDLSGFKTDNVTDMGWMFDGCPGLTSLDLSSFKTDNVTKMHNMFLGCSKLENIFVGSEWSTAKVTESTDMFKGCTSLIGGMGTQFDENHVDHTYAHIDEGKINYGYFTRFGSSKIIEINETNFPDENFRNYLKAQSYGSDDVIKGEEIADIKEIDVSVKQISSLKGIEYFTELTGLNCYYNQLTSLDVSKNTALTILICGGNQLTSLDVSKNAALTALNCHYNKLSSLDISKNTELTELHCYTNQLTSLDLSENTALTMLSCDRNKLNSLDLSNNTKLSYLVCGSNELISLDLSKNTALTTLSCHSNKLTSLDLSKNTALSYLSCYSNQIKGEKMDVLVKSLPSVENRSLNIFYNENEGNEMTTVQVAAAKAKGWIPKYYDGSNWAEYAGTPVEFKLTYMVDDVVYKSCDVEFGATITPEADPEKETYRFSGWSEIPETMPAHDVTITGTFERYFTVGHVAKLVNFIINGNATTDDVELYDLNTDGELNIGDIILVVKWILNNDNSGISNSRTRSYDMPDLSQYTAAQFDVKTAADTNIKEIRLVKSMEQTHQMMYLQKDANTYSVVVYSLSNQLMKPENGGIVEIDTENGSQNGLSIENIIVAQPTGETQSYSGGQMTTNIQQIESDGGSTIVYDLKGNRMNGNRGLKKGVYIVNGKKVIVK